MLSWILHLRSIIVTRDLMWYIYCVCLGQTKYLRQALTNGCAAAIMTIGELTTGKGWLAMLSWVSYLWFMMVSRDWMWYIYCFWIGETSYLRQALTNGCTAALVMILEIARDKRWLAMRSWISHLRSIMVTCDWFCTYTVCVCLEWLNIWGKHLPMGVLQR